MPHPQDKETVDAWLKREHNIEFMGRSADDDQAAIVSIGTLRKIAAAALSLPSPDPAAGKDAAPAQQGGGEEPFAHICILPTKDAGPTKFFTAPSDPRGFPVYRAPQQHVDAVFDDCLNFPGQGDLSDAEWLARRHADKDGARLHDFYRGVIAALGVLATWHKHGTTEHDEIVKSVGKEALYRHAEPEDVEWAGLDPNYYAALTTATPEQGGSNG